MKEPTTHRVTNLAFLNRPGGEARLELDNGEYIIVGVVALKRNLEGRALIGAYIRLEYKHGKVDSWEVQE